MSDIIPVRQKGKGRSGTKAALIAAYPTHVLYPSEGIRSSDGWMTWGDGSTQLQNLNWVKIDLTNERFQAKQLLLDNAITSWLLYGSDGSGAFKVYDVDTARNVMTLETGTLDGLLYGYASGQMAVGGGFMIDTGGQLTITTGTYNDLDIADTAVLYCDTYSGDIIINGFSGGKKGQKIDIVKVNSLNNLEIRHGNASGTQKIYTGTSGTYTKTGGYINRRVTFINTSYCTLDI